jgi:predicted RNA polymerase sigma factor
MHGARAGLRALAEIEGRARLASYHLLHAVTGQLQHEAGDRAAACASFRLALGLAKRALLEARLAGCGS